MQSAVVSITVMQLMPVPPMVVGAIAYRSKMSWLATPVQDTRRPTRNLPTKEVGSPTQDTRAAATLATSDPVIAGNDHEYYTGFGLRTMRAAAASQDGVEDRRWRYRVRITASVFGSPCDLP